MREWFHRLGDRFRQFMVGRYGPDGLNQFLSLVSLALLVLALFTHFGLLYWAGIAVLIWQYYRMFSRNISARTAENYKFYTLKQKGANWGRQQKIRWDNRKVYRYFRCPQCRQQLRVPRGRGRIQITCPKCGTRFIKKS